MNVFIVGTKTSSNRRPSGGARGTCRKRSRSARSETRDEEEEEDHSVSDDSGSDVHDSLILRNELRQLLLVKGGYVSVSFLP